MHIPASPHDSARIARQTRFTTLEWPPELPNAVYRQCSMASTPTEQAATTHGVSRVTLARMTLNIVIDLVVGALPIVGDLFDVYWKANKKNVELLRRHVQANRTTERTLRRSDGLFVAGMIALILTILVASIAGAYFILAWIAGSLSQLSR